MIEICGKCLFSHLTHTINQTQSIYGYIHLSLLYTLESNGSKNLKAP